MWGGSKEENFSSSRKEHVFHLCIFLNCIHFPVGKHETFISGGKERKEKLGEFLIDTGKPRPKQDNDFQLQTQHPILGPLRSHNWRFPCARVNERMSYFIKYISMHTQSNCP